MAKLLTVRRHESLTANTRPFERPIRTTDSIKSKDMLLTTSNRLTASPPNPIERGSMGKIWNGVDDGKESDGVDVAAVWNALQLGLSSLNAADLAAIKEKVARFAGGVSSRTTPLGVTSFDSSRTTDARKQIDGQIGEIRKMQDANVKFWDDIYEQNYR